jgi:tRNA(Ile)-lysidine synthase
MELSKRVRETIKKYSMLSENDSILLGLSGGPDSVCLALILDKIKKDFNLLVNAVYVNHGLRPDEVENEKKFCKDLCDNLGIGFSSKSVDVKKYAKDRKLNKQEAARELRYKAYEEISSQVNATKIALGHTADDQAETFLMRLLRGSGQKGLSGIPPVRGRIIRPLIEVERKDIEKFLADDSLPAGEAGSLIINRPKGSPKSDSFSPPFIIDSSNLKTDYFRNWVRQIIIPELKKRNPALIKTICRSADILREEDAYFEIVVTKTLMRLISRKSNDTIELFLIPLETMEKPILRRVLRRVIEEMESLRGIGFVHLEDMISLIKDGRAGDRLYLPKGIRVIKGYSLLIMTSAEPVRIAEYELQPPCEVAVSGAGIVIKALFEEKSADLGDGKASVLLDAGAMNFPLKVRPRANGDFFFPLGFGKKKKLQDFFVDEKIPRDERDKIPVILSGNDIVWISGYRADERFRITDKTENFLRLIITKDV